MIEKISIAICEELPCVPLLLISSLKSIVTKKRKPSESERNDGIA